MGLIKCQDCGHDISNQAKACVKCGRPCDNTNESRSSLHGAWAAVTRSKTPINLFAIAMMSCAAILGMSATQIDNDISLTAFTYTLHTFLAVSGMFFVTILFCRKGIYHPEDLAKAKRNGVIDFGEDRPVIAAVLIGFMLIAYGMYQAIRAGVF